SPTPHSTGSPTTRRSSAAYSRHSSRAVVSFLSMSGRGTASVVFEAIAELAELPRWRDSLQGSSCPWYFFGPEEYEAWLTATGFLSRRIELVPRSMRHAG